MKPWERFEAYGGLGGFPACVLGRSCSREICSRASASERSREAIVPAWRSDSAFASVACFSAAIAAAICALSSSASALLASCVSASSAASSERAEDNALDLREHCALEFGRDMRAGTLDAWTAGAPSGECPGVMVAIEPAPSSARTARALGFYPPATSFSAAAAMSSGVSPRPACMGAPLCIM